MFGRIGSKSSMKIKRKICNPTRECYHRQSGKKWSKNLKKKKMCLMEKKGTSQQIGRIIASLRAKDSNHYIPHTDTYIYPHIPTHTHTHIPTIPTHIHTQTYPHTDTHTHSHTHTYTHIHTPQIHRLPLFHFFATQTPDINSEGRLVQWPLWSILEQ